MAQHYEKTLKILLIVLVILNFADAILTLHWIDQGIAQEANPLMRAWIQISPDLFIAIKITLVILGTALLWICRKNKLAYWAGIFCLSIYSLIIFIHGHIAVYASGL